MVAALRWISSIAAYLVFCQVAMGCAGAGMIQHFPLAENKAGQIWLTQITTVRSETGSLYTCTAKLLLIDQQLLVFDSIDVGILHSEEKNIGGGQYHRYSPLHLVSSLYRKSVQRLRKQNREVQWLELDGYCANSDSLDGPLQFEREAEVVIWVEADKYQNRDTTFTYSDTLNKLVKIKLFDRDLINPEIIGIQEYIDDYSPPPLTGIINTVRLYRLPSGGFIVTLHYNIMGHFSDEEPLWHNLQLKTDSVEGAPLFQDLTWHHSGEDRFLFVTD